MDKEAMHIEIKVTGPKGSGKTYFVTKNLVPFLKKHMKKIMVIDELEKEIKGSGVLSLSAKITVVQHKP